MELDFALIATAAEAMRGKLHLLGGGFDTFQVAELPAVVPPFAVVARFIASNEELSKEHTIGLEVVSPEGKTQAVLDEVGKLPFKGSEEGKRPQALGIIQVGFKFDSAGKYQLKLFGDGEVVKTFDLYVVLNSDVAKGLIS